MKNARRIATYRLGKILKFYSVEEKDDEFVLHYAEGYDEAWYKRGYKTKFGITHKLEVEVVNSALLDYVMSVSYPLGDDNGCRVYNDNMNDLRQELYELVQGKLYW